MTIQTNHKGKPRKFIKQICVALDLLHVYAPGARPPFGKPSGYIHMSQIVHTHIFSVLDTQARTHQLGCVTVHSYANIWISRPGGVATQQPEVYTSSVGVAPLFTRVLPPATPICEDHSQAQGGRVGLKFFSSGVA